MNRVASDGQRLLWAEPQEPYFHLFRVEIGNVTVIRYALSGDQHVARWPSGKEFVRRATPPTGVGVEEPVVDLLRPTTS